MFEVLGLGSHEPIPEDVLRSDDFDEILIHAKLRYAHLLKIMPELARPVGCTTKRADLTAEEKAKFSYIDDILEICGNTVTAIALYGSAAKEINPRNYSDYDNFLVVKDGSLGFLYPRLKGRKFKHKDGKKVGLNLVEESVISKIIRFQHDPNEFLEYCKVLYGEIDFPEVPWYELKERGNSYAILRTKALKSACSWVTKEPNILKDKKDLFDYFMKTQLFIIQSALNQTEGIKFRTKDEFKERLAEVGGRVHPFKPDPRYILYSIYQATVTATKLLEKYYPDKEFKARRVMRF
jgi:hypothetical protein